MNYMYKALWNNCLLLWELDSLTLEVLASLIFCVCLFDHNSGKGAHALGPCPLGLKLNLSSLANHLTLSFDFFSLLCGRIFHVFISFKKKKSNCALAKVFLSIPCFSNKVVMFFNPRSQASKLTQTKSIQNQTYQTYHPCINTKYYDIKWTLGKSGSFIVQLCAF